MLLRYPIQWFEVLHFKVQYKQMYSKGGSLMQSAILGLLCITIVLLGSGLLFLNVILFGLGVCLSIGFLFILFGIALEKILGKGASP